MCVARILILATLIWSAAVSAGSAQTDRPEVVLLRGGAGYWPGVSALAHDLESQGFSTRVSFGYMYSHVADEITTDYQSGNCSGPLTIVGYSSGADLACKLCQTLQSRGIPVYTLVLLESTLGTPVPGNVELCINMYESRPHTDWLPVFRGIPVVGLNPETQVLNLDVRYNEDLQWLTQYNHFTIASGSEMRVTLRNLLVLRRSQYQQQLQPQQVNPPQVSINQPSAPVILQNPAAQYQENVTPARINQYPVNMSPGTLQSPISKSSSPQPPPVRTMNPWVSYRDQSAPQIRQPR